jgi:glutamate/tyrosine decarboxylase-like PLP-dependent enzyme
VANVEFKDKEEFAELMEALAGPIRADAGAFPQKGKKWDEVGALLDAALQTDIDEAHGKLTLYSLKGSAAVQEVVERAWSRFFSLNAVFSAAMPSVFRMETELTHWVAGFLGGGPDARSFLTSGGTESIFHGVKSARDRAREKMPRVVAPEMVVPATAHAAFHKAADILGVTEVRVPVGDDFRADVGAMEDAITPDTIMLAGSAPSWPYGRYDDIGTLASLARRRGLWFHSDACFGGFLAPFVRELGHPVPDFDLGVDGVCSLSSDLHKYGYAAKPASTITYADRELARYQLFYFDDWASGVYPTYSFAGSRPAGAVAAAWAVINFLGREGYLRLARRTMEVKQALTEGINSIDGLRVLDTDLSILLYGVAGDLDILAVSRAMSDRGYYVMGTRPDLIHMTLDPVEDGWIEAYLADLREAVASVRSGEVGGEDGTLRYI